MAKAKAKKTAAAPPAPAMRVEMMDLDEVLRRAFPGNPKAHDDVALGESFDAAGYVDPIVLDEKTGRNVSGHGRAEKLAAMRDAGSPPPERVVAVGKRWFVPVIRGVEFKDAGAAKKYLLAANRVGELGGWDNRALADFLGTMGGDFVGTGFEEGDLVRFLAASAAPSAPDAFQEVTENLATEHECPKCGYAWSGSSAPRPKEPDAEESPRRGRKRAAAA